MEIGRAKDEMMRQEALLDEATSIAVEASVLGQCELHPEIAWDIHGDPAEAYKLGNAKFTEGVLLTHFKSRRELTDAIKQAIEESGMDGCPFCAKMLED